MQQVATLVQLVLVTAIADVRVAKLLAPAAVVGSIVLIAEAAWLARQQPGPSGAPEGERGARPEGDGERPEGEGEQGLGRPSTLKPALILAALMAVPVAAVVVAAVITLSVAGR